MSETAERRRIDALVATFFGCFDNRSAMPTRAAIAACFTDRALIVRRSAAGTDLYSVDAFAEPRLALLAGGSLIDFHEYETTSTTAVFDGIATRTSRYAKAGVLDGADYRGSGTKCFQLVLLDDGWRIASLAWVDDR